MLRSFLVPLVVLLLLPSFGRAMMTQDLAITLHPDQQLLEGRAILHGNPAPGKEAVFFLASGTEVMAVKKAQKPIPYRFENGRLFIWDTAPDTPTTIDYRIRFDNLLPKNMVNIEDPSFGIAATITPEGTYLSEASGWHPRPASNRSRYRVAISGPPGLVGVTSGTVPSSVRHRGNSA